MRAKFWKLLSRVRNMMQEDGQDLVEYALLVALIAFAATAGIKTLSNDINSAFTAVGSKLTSATIG